MNNWLEYIKKRTLNWVYIIFVMYCTCSCALLCFYVLIKPNLEILVAEINPIAIICATFGAFILAAIIALEITRRVSNLDKLQNELNSLTKQKKKRR